MLDDDCGLSSEVGQVGEKGAGGVEVIEVVEGDLTPLQLLYATQQMLCTYLSIVGRGLVRVLPVAQPRAPLVSDGMDLGKVFGPTAGRFDVSFDPISEPA